jgi:hypothetical protein
LAAFYVRGLILNGNKDKETTGVEIPDFLDERRFLFRQKILTAVRLNTLVGDFNIGLKPIENPGSPSCDVLTHMDIREAIVDFIIRTHARINGLVEYKDPLKIVYDRFNFS